MAASSLGETCTMHTMATGQMVPVTHGSGFHAMAREEVGQSKSTRTTRGGVNIHAYGATMFKLRGRWFRTKGGAAVCGVEEAM